MQLPLLLPKESVRPVPVLNTTFTENYNETFPLSNISKPTNTTAYSQHQRFSTSNVNDDKYFTSTSNTPIHAISIPVLNNTSYTTQEPIRSEIFPQKYACLPQPVINLPLCTYVEESKMLKPPVKFEPNVNVTQQENYLKDCEGFAHKSGRSSPELDCLRFFSHKLNDKLTDSNTLLNSKYRGASELIKKEPLEYNSNTAKKRSTHSRHVDETQKKRKFTVEICEPKSVETNKATDTSVNYVDTQHVDSNETNSYKSHVESASKETYQTNNQEGTKAIESVYDHTSRVPNDSQRLPYTGADLSGDGNDKVNVSYIVRSNIKSDRTSQSLCDIDVPLKKCYMLSIDEQEKHSIAKNPSEKLTTLSNIKLKSVQDHHLLNTRISLHEASKLICSDRVDPYFKQELTSRVQHKQAIGVGSSKQLDPTDKQANTVHYDGSGEMILKSTGNEGNSIQLIRPRKEQTYQMSDAKNSSKPSLKDSSKQSLNSVSSLSKLEEISKNNQHIIATPIDSDVKIINLVRPEKERDPKMLDAKTNSDTENLPKQSMTPVIRIGKLEGISKDSVVSIIPTADKRNESSFKLSKSNIGNSKKLFYIISSGKHSKPQLNSEQIEITKQTDMPQVSDKSVEKSNTNAYKMEKTFISKSISPKSFKLNGLIVASPKPITQEIYKELQVNANIVRSLKAPVFTKTKVVESEFKSTLAHVDNTKVILQVKEMNKKTEMPCNQLYNSKLTVAQLLRNKRGEEQLELMLRSKLNTSSNALNGLINTDEQTTSAESSASITSHERPDNTPTSMIIDDKTRSPEQSCQPYEQVAQLSKSSGTQISTASVENITSQFGNRVNSTVTVTKGETVHETAPTSGDLTPDFKQDTFSVRLGGKMVVMRKPQTPPEKMDNSRKKLPAPRSRKQYELSVKQETLKRLKNKLKNNSLTQKNLLIEKLQLMPTSKLIKKLKIIKQNELHQYSFKMQSAIPNKMQTQREVPSSTAEVPVSSDDRDNYFQDALVPIVQIWKGGKGNVKHKLQVANLKHSNSNDAMFHRWHEYSDYPCVIHSTLDEIIRQIDIESYKQGFYLLTRTDNSLNKDFSENEYKIPAILSLYPSDLSLLPIFSRAIVIGTELNGENERGAILSKFEKCNNDLESMIRLLLQIPENGHWKKDSRYSSVIDETMSPRAYAPMFYSTNMHAYFSDMNQEELNKSRDKDCSRSTGKGPVKTKYLTKLPSCSSKAAALKKKQNALLKTCLKIKKARHLSCVDKIDKSEAALSIDVATEKQETKADLEKKSVNDGPVSFVEETVIDCKNVNDFKINQYVEETLTVD